MSTTTVGLSHTSGALYRQWTSGTFDEGCREGTRVQHGCLVISEPVAAQVYTDPFGAAGQVEYELARWTSPDVAAAPSCAELVASWNVRTPPGTWVEVAVEVGSSTAAGTNGETFVLGRWAETATDIHRLSVQGQSSSLARVECDRLITDPSHPLSRWRVMVTLLRRCGTSATPAVSLLGAMTSPPPPTGSELALSLPGRATGRVLDVPAYSQTLHRGEYPEYNNGGEAWCSPTSTAMVLDFWGRGPGEADYAWVDASYPDRWVDHAAAATFDHAYAGCGNWSFNAAYAGTFGVRAFVTRLSSLREVEQFIHAGIPVVVSVTFAQGELDGAGYGTAGHLLVVVGFTEAGDVVCNDPASHLVPSNAGVQTTYQRAQLERAWLAGSGGISYIIHPAEQALPPRPADGPAAW